MSAHTPGPWELRLDHQGAPMEVVASGDRESVACACAKCATRAFLGSQCFARILETDGHHYGPTLQDARLIAAAPELLAALRELLAAQDRINDGGQRLFTAMQHAQTIIAKAEGRS